MSSAREIEFAQQNVDNNFSSLTLFENRKTQLQNELLIQQNQNEMNAYNNSVQQAKETKSKLQQELLNLLNQIQRLNKLLTEMQSKQNELNHKQESLKRVEQLIDEETKQMNISNQEIDSLEQ